VIVRRLGPGDEHVLERLAEQGPPARAGELLADERTLLLAAFDREEPEPVGFVLAYELLRRHGDPSRLFVYEVGVAPAARRRGVATELLRELARIARERGIRHGFVLTNEANEAAMELYRSLGGVRPNADDVLFDFDYDGS
jgi:ribosomal protein S18 acetylase RimI-like enzyme